MAKEKIAEEWFNKGQKDIDDAEFLLNNNRAVESISFHIHQSIEKYLKGFLIYNGWKFYFESRYPVGYEVAYTRGELRQSINQAKKLIKSIKKKTLNKKSK